MGRVDSCIVMDSAADVQSLTRGHPMLGTDARVMVCAEKSRAVEGDEPGVYSISDGTMVDICVAGAHPLSAYCRHISVCSHLCVCVSVCLYELLCLCMCVRMCVYARVCES